MENNFFYELNWASDFDAKFVLKSDLTLKHIPNNIFSIELPDIEVSDINTDDCNKIIKIILRSPQGGCVEKEIFDILMRNSFDIIINFTKQSNISWVYKDCSIEKVGFTPLISKKSAIKPFNFILYTKVSKITYKADDFTIAFGANDETNYIDHNKKINNLK